jgi:hypothetical protein
MNVTDDVFGIGGGIGQKGLSGSVINIKVSRMLWSFSAVVTYLFIAGQ